MDTGASWNRPRMTMTTSCSLRSLTGACTRQRMPTEITTRGALTAARSRHRVGICGGTDTGNADGPTLQALPTILEGATCRLAASTRYRCLLAMRWLGEECRGRRLSHGHKRDWQTIVAGVTTRATASASPIRESGQGRRERGAQLGRIRGEKRPPAT